MPTINEANQEQIRPPMNIVASLQFGNDVALTYSGYSAAKVADGVLDEPDWTMRTLADLQGDGFPLDGTCWLYYTFTASMTLGKLGVRSDIGSTIDVTITATENIGDVSIWVSGCSSVTYGGQDYPVDNNVVLLDIIGTTATLTFSPEAADRRVEVENIMTGTYYRFDNDTIISCVVSLRSDLSIDNPTLPESEITLQVYQDEDMSEILSAIPNETPLTYSAGYVGDMSPTRHFYLAEKITWADNVMTIRAVDAIHKLDQDTPSSILLGGASAGMYEAQVFLFVEYCLNYVNVGSYTTDYRDVFHNRVPGYNLILPQGSMRSYIANINNLMHVDVIDEELWIQYVDAGLPCLVSGKQTVNWDIYEEDCGDVIRNVDRKIAEIKVPVTDMIIGDTSANSASAEIGKGTWIKGSGAFLDFEDYCYLWTVQDAAGTAIKYLSKYYESTQAAYTHIYAPSVQRYVDSGSSFGTLLMDGGRPIGSVAGMYSGHWHEYYTQVMPWNAEQATAWDADIGAAVTDNQDVTIYGAKYVEDTSTVSFTSEESGETLILDEAPFLGRLRVSDDNGVVATVYPELSMGSLLARSNVTGSFTWKGNPKMQPRDVARFHRLDGSVEEITLENITITHEAGGTSAEITYRKGWC